jgi:hypothetical protein
VDPSKLRISQLFELLDHWRERRLDSMEPLIWNPLCELLKGGEICSKNTWRQGRQQPRSSSKLDSLVTVLTGRSLDSAVMTTQAESRISHGLLVVIFLAY